MYVSVSHAYIVSVRSDKGARSPGTGITDGCELSCVLGIEPRALERLASAHNC